MRWTIKMRWTMKIPVVAAVATVAACAAPGRPVHETDDACVHRYYDYSARTMPFQSAVAECRPDGPIDFTGDRYYQLLASSLNVPYVTRTPEADSRIALTGGRIPQPTDRPADPQLSFR
ncbi:hypothetical protein [Lichenicoccus sp.]|uniref:hypothetical protein n=1 Tax=Lichenicoccus sp. TaxID=2781899 RepID=UPI003D0A4B48